MDCVSNRETGEHCGRQRGNTSPPIPADFDRVPRESRYPAADPHSQQDGEQQCGDQNREALSHFAAQFGLGDFVPLILGLVSFLHRGEGEGKGQQDEQDAQWQEQGGQVQPDAEDGEEGEKGEGVFGEEDEHEVMGI